MELTFRIRNNPSMHTEDLKAFFTVVESGSLTAAAKALELPKSTISRRLARLEADLGSTLLMRTPRSTQVTETGKLLYQQGAPALSHLEEVERLVVDQAAEPSGPLRVSAPPDLAAVHLGALCARFVRACPKVRLSLVASDAFTNLIDDGYDVALRIHVDALDSVTSLRVRKLARVEVGLYAAPSYVGDRGAPRTPAQLADHALLGMAVFTRGWKLTHARKKTTAEVGETPALTCNDHLLLRDAAVAGAGVAVLPSFLAEPSVRDGSLERVLPKWAVQTAVLSVVWLATHHLSPRVRAFVDETAKFFEPPPWERN